MVIRAAPPSLPPLQFFVNTTPTPAPKEKNTITSVDESGANESDEVVVEAVLTVAREGEDEDPPALLQRALLTKAVAVVKGEL